MQGPAYRVQGVMKGNHEGIPFCCYLQWAIKGAQLALTGQSVKADAYGDCLSGQFPGADSYWLDEHDLQRQSITNSMY